MSEYVLQRDKRGRSRTTWSAGEGVSLRDEIRDVLIEWHAERGEAVSMSRLNTLVTRILAVVGGGCSCYPPMFCYPEAKSLHDVDCPIRKERG